MPCAKSTAQSPTADSLAVVRQFISNAGAILDSLTALHFSRLETRLLKAQIQRHEQERDQMTRGYIDAQEQIGKGSLDQLALKQQLTVETRKQRRAQWRNAGLGALTGYLLYRKLCPSCHFLRLFSLSL